ncbi:MAG: hypothetical protein KAS70_08030 [Planctomycetes bacterium]|nr:hypothetical protein [Planctomycetota bacterium]
MGKNLEAEGWTKQFTTSEPRLSESVELYQSLGLEVRLEAADLSNENECQSCLAAEPDKYKTIYTRKKVTSNQ